jgi:uncharacterized protein (DUF433 family)
MSKPVVQYRYLAPKPGSSYKQMFIKGRRISARTLYGQYMSAEEPRTVEEIAADFQLPVEAVQEAIDWCASDPPELRRDMARDEAIMEMSGMNEPGYKYNPQPRPLTSEQWAEINRRFP